MAGDKGTIAVGISGGVDSSVAAHLLKEQGYNVIGIFVKTWSPEWLPCTWIDEKRDAMRVCAALDIPFYFLDATEEYKRGVAEYMIAEYRAGRTPNPDVLCNREVKFGAMWKYAQTLGAAALATGHYARTDGVNLYKAHDDAKDQTYFLWMLRKEELAHIKFPLGEMKKDEVRAIAERAGLMTATKKDSQGICFLGDIDMREFLSHYIEEKKGKVVTEKGEVIGVHDGVWFFTIGERHGFTITQKNTDRVPYYVVAKDIDTNRLVVSTSPVLSSFEGVQHLRIRNFNQFSAIQPEVEYTAQIRYHGELIGAKVIVLSDTTAHVELSNDGVVASGQSILIYQGDMVIAGGIVD